MANVKKDDGNIPVPQYWNPDTLAYEDLEGSNGAAKMQLSGRNAASTYVQTTLNTATAETVNRASGKSMIVVQVESGEVRITTDGTTTPTSSTGQLIGAGFEERFAVASLSVIETSGTAVIQTWSE